MMRDWKSGNVLISIAVVTGGKKEKPTRQTTVRDANKDVEEEHEPSLRVQKRLDYLLPLEGLVFQAKLIASDSFNSDGLLPLTNELCTHHVVWKEQANDA